MKIVIAGASGFVGKLLLKNFADRFELIALGRFAPQNDSARQEAISVTWRSCDLFSLLQTEKALAGADVGIYLVHSMLPRARLTQSSFEDLDLVLADNFARAAKGAGLKRIIYLSGLIPAGEKLSKHLESRKEVERALSSTGIPVTTLRAGLILGSEGSSFQMLYLLVKRLPVMICPQWTKTLTQCIAASDVVELIRYCIENGPETEGKTFDIGTPEILSYRDLMAVLSKEMRKKRYFFSVPYFSPGLSRLWVQLITGGSRNLVSPLIESLRHEMLVHDDHLLKLFGRPLLGVREALRQCLQKIKPTLRSSTLQRIRQLRGTHEVRSIQRLPLPEGKTATWIATEYFKWLPQFLAPLIRVTHEDGDYWIFRLIGMKTPMLKLWHHRERSTQDRELFFIRGGLLAKADQNPMARLEFREVLHQTASLAAIHEFRPALPWGIYRYTQAVLHLWVMYRFRKHLTSI